ncbi:adenosylcobinamide-phosphate synthase [Humibacillus xanthopallidus]|uniref:Cobalamin biosynthesis protein CobD n=1 Tax=Humibacillus xanthopallidus TaxID=412689 RepID=A0A543PL59_9MICO|nr:cobalamin biosynthesis protein [Humibacillus xanthopallidus]TQN44808.1 adenosylcobinamide-phosphate synthase [Humibacillus xanthopallidus]
MSRALGLALGWAADQVLGDPRRWHPVAGFGHVATALEGRTYAARRGPGVAHVALLVGAAATTGLVAERITRRRPVAHTLATAMATWAVLGGRSLIREAATIERQLDGGDLIAARVQVRNLVGRDTARLGPDEVARACIESLAENTSDAVVAPLLWGAAAGMPGLLGYRAVNTLDAMVGHRNARYAEFGWAAARLDDIVNWIPARVAAALAVAAGPPPGRGARSTAIRAVRRDAAAHPSPNGGVVEAAFAGVLGVRLGGSNAYDGRVEDRGVLGDGPSAGAGDIAVTRRLAQQVSAGAALVAVTLAGRGHRHRRRHRP